MPFYGPFALGEVGRPAAERRFREQVPNISSFSMDMPRNTLGFTSETAGLFGGGAMPTTFGAAIGALPQSTNPLGLSPKVGMFEGTSARPESLSGRIDAGGETGGVSPGAPAPGVGEAPGPGPAAGPAPAGPGLSGFDMSNVMGFLSEVSAQSPAARVGSRFGIPSELSNLVLSFAPPPISLVNMAMGLASALAPKEAVTEKSQVVQDLSKVVDAMVGITNAPPPAISEEETSFQEAAQAQGQPAAPPDEGPATTGLGLGPPGVAEGAASAASPSGLSGAEASTAAGAEGGEAGGPSVICTELFRQGRLDASVYRADAQFGAWLAQHAPTVLAGYHRWAPTVVRWMRRSLLVSRLVALAARPWAREMARWVDPQRERGSLIGFVMMALGWRLCARLGQRRAPEDLAR